MTVAEPEFDIDAEIAAFEVEQYYLEDTCGHHPGMLVDTLIKQRQFMLDYLGSVCCIAIWDDRMPPPKHDGHASFSISLNSTRAPKSFEIHIGPQIVLSQSKRCEAAKQSTREWWANREKELGWSTLLAYHGADAIKPAEEWLEHYVNH